jgi:hypothetical protein
VRARALYCGIGLAGAAPPAAAMTVWDRVAECDSGGNRKIKPNTASDSTKKIAKKAAPRKYSASDKTVCVKRSDTPNKIAKLHHVKGGWKALWNLYKRRSRTQT